MRATLDDASFGQHDECSRLFALASLGDAGAAEQLYARCVPPLRAWLEARIGWSRAEDIAHDALVVAFQKSGRFHSGAAFTPWLKTIAWRLAQNALRDDARRCSRERAYIESKHLHDRSAPETEARRRAAVDQCLAALPEAQLQMIRSRYYEGRSSETIAATQGRTRVAVAVSLHRTCARLRSEIEKIFEAGRLPAQT